jgi:homoserine dehydrogenase
LRVGVLGAGTVGGEVIRAFLERRRPRAPAPADGQAARPRRGRRPGLARGACIRRPDDLLTDAPAHLVASPDIDVLVEVMGGHGTRRGRSILGRWRQARPWSRPTRRCSPRTVRAGGGRPGSRAPISGSRRRSAGGIPVLSPLASDLAANRVSSVRGHRQRHDELHPHGDGPGGPGVRDVLADATGSRLRGGRPDGRCRGLDAAAKLVILIRLAFGAWIEPSSVERRPLVRGGVVGPAGITGVTPRMSRPAIDHGRVLKLVAVGAACWTMGRSRPRSCRPRCSGRRRLGNDGRASLNRDRGRGVAGRVGRLRAARRGWRGHVVGGARRPRGDRARRLVDLGGAAGRGRTVRRSPSGRPGETLEAPSGACYPMAE